MDTKLRPARVVSPGRIIRRELEARGWAQKDLADIMGRPAKTINEIIQGHTQITIETARQLAQAFGTSPEFWINLETAYRLHLADRDREQDSIARRSRLYGLAPIAELVKRGWIKPAATLEGLEQEVCQFLGIDSPEQQPHLATNFRAARHAQADEAQVKAETAWVKRVEYLVRGQPVTPFEPDRLRAAIGELLGYAAEEDGVRHVPGFLRALGVHFVVVPHLPHTRIDGAAFVCEGHPVIALTLRYDRIDSFWFTTVHELAHIVAGHEGLYLDDLEKREDRAPGREEMEADQLARDWLIPHDALSNFVAGRYPRFSQIDIRTFADQIRRHPGIVVGRLQYDELVPYKNFRRWLVKVRQYLVPWIDAVPIG